MQTARERIVGLLREADVGATVTHAAVQDLTDRAVVFVESTSASVDGERLSNRASRWSWTWNLRLAVMSKRYHLTGDQAEAEVAAIVDAVFRALAAAGRLETADLAPLAGLEWLEVSSAELLNATLAPDVTVGQWEAGATIGVTLHTRSAA